jgi:uncharacterized protein YndB with AHSA1/START domain
MSIMTDAPVLYVKRVFDASPARVFDAWLTHEQFQQWIGPEGVNCDVPLFEPRVGGRYKIVMKMSDGSTIPVAGTFKTVDRPKSFSMTWKWENGEHDSLVTVSLRDVDGKTELTLRHDGLQTAENCAAHERGWNSALNKMGRLLTGAAA